MNTAIHFGTITGSYTLPRAKAKAALLEAAKLRNTADGSSWKIAINEKRDEISLIGSGYVDSSQGLKEIDQSKTFIIESVSPYSEDEDEAKMRALLSTLRGFQVKP